MLAGAEHSEHERRQRYGESTYSPAKSPIGNAGKPLASKFRVRQFLRVRPARSQPSMGTEKNEEVETWKARKASGK